SVAVLRKVRESEGYRRTDQRASGQACHLVRNSGAPGAGGRRCGAAARSSGSNRRDRSVSQPYPQSRCFRIRRVLSASGAGARPVNRPVNTQVKDTRNIGNLWSRGAYGILLLLLAGMAATRVAAQSLDADVVVVSDSSVSMKENDPQNA